MNSSCLGSFILHRKMRDLNETVICRSGRVEKQIIVSFKSNNYYGKKEDCCR